MKNKITQLTNLIALFENSESETPQLDSEVRNSLVSYRNRYISEYIKTHSNDLTDIVLNYLTGSNVSKPIFEAPIIETRTIAPEEKQLPPENTEECSPEPRFTLEPVFESETEPVSEPEPEPVEKPVINLSDTKTRLTSDNTFRKPKRTCFYQKKSFKVNSPDGTNYLDVFIAPLSMTEKGMSVHAFGIAVLKGDESRDNDVIGASYSRADRRPFIIDVGDISLFCSARFDENGFAATVQLRGDDEQNIALEEVDVYNASNETTEAFGLCKLGDTEYYFIEDEQNGFAYALKNDNEWYDCFSDATLCDAMIDNSARRIYLTVDDEFVNLYAN